MDRRSFLAGTSLIALAGCTKCKLPPLRPIAQPVADAHAHFFNASDLPVRGFLRHVIAPAWFPDLPDIVLALGDLVGELAKRLSITARSEIRRLGPGTLLGSDGPDAARFGREAALYQQCVINDRGFVPLARRSPAINLADSHLLLALTLGVVRFSRLGSERESFADGIEIDAAVYIDIVDPEERQRARSEQAVPDAYRIWAARGAIDVGTIIRWIFLMCQSRCAHVQRYQEVIQTSDLAVRDAANLLVDYDAWLGDAPLDGSDHRDQVAYWTRYAAVAKKVDGVVRLHSFAGFCPLKDAEQLMRRIPNTSFEQMKPWIEAGRNLGHETATHRIAGFKLYPPMGFAPDTNIGLKLPDARAGAIVNTRWKTNGWPLDDLGKKLDASLDAFFRYCATEDVPIMTHAAMSNGSMAGADQMAAPLRWLDRATTVADYGLNPLRICLGHFDVGGLNELVLVEALRMNRGSRPRANIFSDISYDEEILANRPTDLLDGLARACREVGDEGDYIMFGSDWMMLGQQPTARNYLENIRVAASKHIFWQDKLDKIFRTNFLRFLNLPV